MIWPKRTISQWSQKGILIAGPKAFKWQKIASKRLLARIWPKRAVSQWFQRNLNYRSKGPQMAENCFQKAPGQDLAQKGRFPMVPEGVFNCRPKGLPAKKAVSQWSQKGILIAGPKAFKWQKIASKRLLARIWPKRAVSPMVPKGDFDCRPKGPQMAENCFQKAPGQDLVQNGRFPMVPEGFFFLPVQRPSNGRKLLPKGPGSSEKLLTKTY